jgi:nicotinate-nucleotide pyrophosphorylase (carboxylating)
MSSKNYYKDFDFKLAGKVIKDALKEDLGKGDVTSNFLIPAGSVSKANIVFKDNGIIAGLELLKLVFKSIDKNIFVKFYIKDGEMLGKGDLVGEISGNTRKILSGERLGLNIIQRMSGIATSVNKLKGKLNNNTIKIIDTRKTTPNLRIFEKLAVRIGGGDNHRFGLYDMILIKDNHIAANDGIVNTLKRVKEIRKKTELKIEIEVKNLYELESVVRYGKNYIDIVMLDNFKIEDIKKAIKMVNKIFKIEISGGVNTNNISLYSRINGINFISSGFITHSVKSLDIALDFIS